MFGFHSERRLRWRSYRLRRSAASVLGRMRNGFLPGNVRAMPVTKGDNVYEVYEVYKVC